MTSKEINARAKRELYYSQIDLDGKKISFAKEEFFLNYSAQIFYEHRGHRLFLGVIVYHSEKAKWCFQSDNRYYSSAFKCLQSKFEFLDSQSRQRELGIA